MNLTCDDVDWIAKAEVEPVATKAAQEEGEQECRQFVSRRLATSDAPYISPFQMSKWTISKWCFFCLESLDYLQESSCSLVVLLEAKSLVSLEGVEMVSLERVVGKVEMWQMTSSSTSKEDIFLRMLIVECDLC